MDSFIPSAAEAGYAYVELGVSSSLRPETADASHIDEINKSLAQNGVVSEALNLMLPGGFHCVGPNIDENRLERYFELALPRAAAVGAKVLVFGSGTQRTVPDGFEHAKGWLQYKHALRLAGKQAEKYGIVIAIEPLNHLESNLINSVAQSTALAIDVNLPSVKVLSDLYHVETDKQPFSETSAAGPLLAHVHIAGAGRRGPVEGDIPVLTEYFSALKAAGYDSRISIEANWTDIVAQAGEALRVTKIAWLAA